MNLAVQVTPKFLTESVLRLNSSSKAEKAERSTTSRAHFVNLIHQAKELAPMRKKWGLLWWRELLILLGLYVVYGRIRNANDSSQQAVEKAYENAERVISIEDKLGLLVENTVQNFFIDHVTFIQFWNLYYGFFHFAATVVALVATYLYRPKTFGYWRTVGISATGLALVGYATFPLMPPRLVSKCKDDVYGSMCDERFSFVDTVVEMGGLWSFESEGMAAVSNQFAAMPSLHIGWALWCGLILFKESSALWSKILAVAHPFLTLFAIVVTANHWWLDAIGGALVVAFGVIFAKTLHTRIDASIFRKPEFTQL